MSATSLLDGINYNENLYLSSTDEAKEASKYTASDEAENVSHDEFLQLLVTQMTNQDPLQPMQDTEMMAQFAQLQQLDNQKAMTESIVQMREDYAIQGASNLIGKEITVTSDSGATTSGLAVRTLYQDGVVKLELEDGSIVNYRDITEVEDVQTGPDIQEASALMQKYVVGIDADAKMHEGIVKNITTKGDQLYVETYEGDMIPVSGIAQVRELTANESSELQNVLLLINQYVEAPVYDEDGNEDGLKSGIVKDVYRKDGQYWVETWGGEGIYINDIESNQYLTTAQMESMESCKNYVDRFVKANDGKAAGIVEGFFFRDGNFYLYTHRGEAIDVDDVYLTRNATSSDYEDYGSTDGMTELQILNLENSIEDQLGKEYSGFDVNGNEVSGVVESIYYRNGLILFGIKGGGEVVSPASLLGA